MISGTPTPAGSSRPGIPRTVIQRHLGHESIQTTSDRYGHLDRKSSRVVADVVGNALKPNRRMRLVSDFYAQLRFNAEFGM
jgi:hypothetical protein